MKNILLLCFFSLITSFSFSQDLIVTIGHDSIECKIDEIYNNHIYFNISSKGQIKSSLLPLNRIEYYEYGFYNPRDTSSYNPTPKTLSPLRFSLNGGISYRSIPVDNRLPSQIVDHIKALRLGFTLGGSASYFFNDHVGVGVKYIFNRSKNKETFPNDVTLEETIMMNFVGPGILVRLKSQSQKGALVLGGRFGYLDYRNNSSLTGYYPVRITGDTYGINFSVGYDFNVSSVACLNLQVDIILGGLTEFQVEENGMVSTVQLPNGLKEDLNRIDLTLALVINP
ncbi:outer membrane beta-barrel protein [Flammeovirga sp. EKP202]|uniref:outer membrane beta-barrel protein n=1 Tax=Flammeovirga sp. EKP202 TaxID=2770592 RepID=UPI00165F4AD2|nr:outer membrane beta-barrel protein [Flammeovirga sp. EKP202]MBD0404836.1 outer membrane beta-barrel protein [Flammeovirga sp. EKP202]